VGRAEVSEEWQQGCHRQAEQSVIFTHDRRIDARFLLSCRECAMNFLLRRFLQQTGATRSLGTSAAIGSLTRISEFNQNFIKRGCHEKH
jgi:hypothetical protein